MSTSAIETASFGVMGLGVMGSSLAKNIADHGFPVAVWNLEPERTDAFMTEVAGQRFIGAKSIEDFAHSLERPRRILIMIMAGDPVDQTLARLAPYLEPGDIVIDGGNSWFEDTRRREQALAERGLHFVGMGVSGGEEGARFGPSLMPGGTKEAWQHLKPVLVSIAAKTASGACVTHVGGDGAGHFVKMVHNGIEYGDMQVIAEVYDVLRKVGRLAPSRLGEVFAEWNEGPLQSFLVEITAKIFQVTDPHSGEPLIDLVDDRAGQKGTGRLTVSLALDLGVAVPTIAAAVDARVMSSRQAERRSAAQLLAGPTAAAQPIAEATLLADAHDAMLLARVCAYAQGMDLIQAGSTKFGWSIDLSEMARIWTGGCIIRSRLLDVIRDVYQRAQHANLMLADEVREIVATTHGALRRFVGLAQSAGVAVPALGASLAWLDALRSASLPLNLTQAQRDAFGAHTYRRVDRPADGPVHSDWL